MIARIGALVSALLAGGCAAQAPELLPPLATVEVPALEPRAMPPAGPRPKPEPAVLVGRTGDEVRAFLGQPALTRRESPAEIWRYGDDHCGIHLFLYAEAGTLRVAHVETRINGAADTTPAQCLDALRPPGSTPPAG